MKRWSFLLLDANVVIVLFKWGIWDRLVAACDLHVSETVIGEAHFFEDDAGNRHDFDLGGDVKSGDVKTFSVAPGDVKSFVESFDPSYIEKLDAGEAESLAYLMKVHEEHFICSADAIVYRVLGNVDRGHQGASLEEVLSKVGLSRSVPWQFSKAFRERWTRAGVSERLQGRGQRGQ
jgi:hypothetical protein